MLRSRRVDSRSRVSCAAARMGTAAARRRIRWSRFSSSCCSSLGRRQGIGGPLLSSGGRRGGGGDHRMDFCPPASSLLRRRLLPRLREACEVGSRSLYRSGLSSCGSLPATGLKTVASPAARRSVVAAWAKDFRLLIGSRLFGAMKTAACLPRVSTAMVAVLPVDLFVIS